jgi:hypothetical protein
MLSGRDGPMTIFLSKVCEKFGRLQILSWLVAKVVLIKDDHLSRNEWLIGRIIETIPSKDGLIRNVVVKTSTSKLRRPVQKLAVFENL